MQDRRLRYRATREGRYRANGRNTLKIALKCAISANSEADFRQHRVEAQVDDCWITWRYSTDLRKGRLFGQYSYAFI